MSMHASPVLPGALRVLGDPSYPVRRFLRAHEDNLVAAVAAVAGPAEAARTKTLAEHLCDTSEVTADDIAEIDQIHQLLSLDLDVKDPRWMDLDPASEEVVRVCLVTDAVAAPLGKTEDQPLILLP